MKAMRVRERLLNRKTGGEKSQGATPTNLPAKEQTQERSMREKEAEQTLRKKANKEEREREKKSRRTNLQLQPKQKKTKISHWHSNRGIKKGKEMFEKDQSS